VWLMQLEAQTSTRGSLEIAIIIQGALEMFTLPFFSVAVTCLMIKVCCVLMIPGHVV